jgi:hypothetical protein
MSDGAVWNFNTLWKLTLVRFEEGTSDKSDSRLPLFCLEYEAF